MVRLKGRGTRVKKEGRKHKFEQKTGKSFLEVVAISTKITYHGVYSVPKREKGIMLNALYVELNVFAALIMFIIMDHGKWRYMTLEQ